MSFKSKRSNGGYRDDDKLAAKKNTSLNLNEPIIRRNQNLIPFAERAKQEELESHFGLRRFFKNQVYVVLYVLVHAVFSVYIRFRIAYNAVSGQIASILRHHHNDPAYIRNDVSTIKRIPQHVSIILSLEGGGRKGDAVEKLIGEVSEVAAWCAAAGIMNLSVYEKTGILKQYMPQVHNIVSQKLRRWFGKHSGPSLTVFARGAEPILGRNQDPIMGLMLLSTEDGRDAIVDLTRVLADMAQKDKLATADITADVIDNELSEAVMAEPDLLISFEPYIDLQGYPPWQIRLTEIYYAPDNHGVGYQVFLQGLRKYGEATFKLGK